MQLIHEPKSHPVMGIIQTNWGLDLSDGEAVVGLGSMVVVRRVINSVYLKDVTVHQFAIVDSGSDITIKWHIPLFVMSMTNPSQ